MPQRAAPCGRHPAGRLAKRLAPRGFYSWGGAPNPPYFFHCKKVSKKLAPREAIKFIFIRAFYNLFYQGLHPLPALLFLIAEKDPAGRTLQKASTRVFTLGVAPQTRLTFFITKKDPAGRTFYSWGGAPNLLFFFSLQKKKAKRLAPWEPIKPILSRAFYNSLRSNK